MPVQTKRTPLDVAKDLAAGLDHEGASGRDTAVIQLSCLLAVCGLRTGLALADSHRQQIAAGKEPVGLSEDQALALGIVRQMVQQPEHGKPISDDHLFNAAPDMRGRKWNKIALVEVDREQLLEYVTELIAAPPAWATAPLPIEPRSPHSTWRKHAKENALDHVTGRPLGGTLWGLTSPAQAPSARPPQSKDAARE